MSEKISWFGDERKKPKEVVGRVGNGMVGIGKLMIAGIMLGVGIRAFTGAMGD